MSTLLEPLLSNKLCYDIISPTLENQICRVKTIKYSKRNTGKQLDIEICNKPNLHQIAHENLRETILSFILEFLNQNCRSRDRDTDQLQNRQNRLALIKETLFSTC